MHACRQAGVGGNCTLTTSLARGPQAYLSSSACRRPIRGLDVQILSAGLLAVGEQTPTGIYLSIYNCIYLVGNYYVVLRNNSGKV